MKEDINYVQLCNYVTISWQNVTFIKTFEQHASPKLENKHKELETLTDREKLVYLA